jgi:hypothetical protein
MEWLGDCGIIGIDERLNEMAERKIGDRKRGYQE